MNDNDWLVEELILMQMYMQRHGNKLAKETINLMLDIRNELASLIERKGHGRATTAHKRLQFMKRESESFIKGIFSGIKRKLFGEKNKRGDLHKFAETQANATAETLNKARKLVIDKGIMKIVPEKPIISPSTINSLVGRSVINGLPVKKWWDKQSNELQEKFIREMNMGIAIGETTEQLMRRLIGGKDENGIKVAGLFNLKKEQAAALARTTANTVGNDAMLESFKKNLDIIEGVRWSTTLNRRTCIRCIARSVLVWNLSTGQGVGHNYGFARPPLHFNCRCVLVAIMLGDPPTSRTFADYLEKQPRKTQIEILGGGSFRKGEMILKWWKAGTLTDLNQLTDSQNNILTINQLKKMINGKNWSGR